MQITKKDIIQKLYEIQEKENLDLEREVQKTIRNEIIPSDVIVLINKYDQDFLKIYNTYNVIYNTRNKNPLYRNLRNKYLITREVAIAVSSLVTKILISCSKIEDEEERKLFASAMNIEDLNNAITKYSLYNDDSELNRVAKEIRELLELLYID